MAKDAGGASGRGGGHKGGMPKEMPRREKHGMPKDMPPRNEKHGMYKEMFPKKRK